MISSNKGSSKDDQVTGDFVTSRNIETGSQKKDLLFMELCINHSKRMGVLLRMGKERLFQNSKEERGREDVGKINVGCKGVKYLETNLRGYLTLVIWASLPNFLYLSWRKELNQWEGTLPSKI